MKNRLIFRIHAVQRMFERNVSLKRVREAVESGVTIEDYSEEMPEPSRLILGYQGNRLFHVVVSENSETDRTIIVTVYIPDPDKWTRDRMSRKA